MRYPKVLGSLYVQVVIGIALGVLLGFAAPEYGAAMRPLGDGFIKLIKMLIAPIIFTTVTVGIAQMGHMKDVGRIGVRALVYFEVVSTAALLIGLVVVNVLKPGAGLHIDPGQLDAASVKAYTSTAQHLGPVDFILGIIPTTIADAFARGEVLQVLLVSVLTGLAMLSLGDRIGPLTSLVEQVSKVLFTMVAMIMRLAPIGAFGAMAFTIGKYGLGTLLSLGQLMAGVYITCLLFVFVVLAGILRTCRFNIVDVLAYIKEEILVVLGTASSESVLPRIMAKLEDLGCAKPVVGLVVPTGYSFNLDGTSIYMTMAAVFVAQATGVDLSLRQELSILAILLLTSKGAAAVTGSGFITLAATLAAVPTIPIAGLALLLGVDRFMSEARAITNLIGNVVATIFIASWDNSLDRATANRVLRRDPAVAGAFRRTAGDRHDGKVVTDDVPESVF
jgi:aerobic C4-dicarboxylate transport protein